MTQPLRPSGLEFRWARWRLQALLVLGRQQRALELLDRLLGRWPTERYLLASRGTLRARRGDWPGAVADLRALVLSHPDEASAWFNLGFALEQQGELSEAEAAFRRAIARNAQLDRAWYGLALVLIRRQRLREAVEPLRRNTALQPMSPYGWYQLARVHVDLDEPEEAEKILRRLEGFEPKVAAQLRRETGLKGAMSP